MNASAPGMTGSDTGLRVRGATGADLPDLVDTLTAAFLADPLMCWWMPDPQRRPQILRALFEVVVDVNHPYGGLYTTDPASAAGAVWVPPGCQPAGGQADELVGWYLDAAAETAERALVVLESMERHHPVEPHAYLFLLGARPEWQGRGLGSALLRQVLDRCDRDATPAYLEATSPDNRRLYLRHGFEVTGEIRLPDGPSLWPMWREPRPVD